MLSVEGEGFIQGKGNNSMKQMQKNAQARFHFIQISYKMSTHSVRPYESVSGITKLCRSPLPNQDYVVMVLYLHQSSEYINKGNHFYLNLIRRHL